MRYLMKTLTFTAVMALLVAIPLIFKKKTLTPVKIVNPKNDHKQSAQNERYAIDDFLT